MGGLSELLKKRENKAEEEAAKQQRIEAQKRQQNRMTGKSKTIFSAVEGRAQRTKKLAQGSGGTNKLGG